MPDSVSVTDLPHVGRRVEFSVGDHLVAVVITHSGDRHLFVRKPDTDAPHLWLDLTDEKARVLAAVLLGVYGRPQESPPSIEVGDLVVREMRISEDSEFLGVTVGELQARQTGLVVIAAEHEKRVDFDPQLHDVIEPGVLIVAGPQVDVESMRLAQ